MEQDAYSVKAHRKSRKSQLILLARSELIHESFYRTGFDD